MRKGHWWKKICVGAVVLLGKARFAQIPRILPRHLLLIRQVLYAALSLQCNNSVEAVRRGALPVLILPWAITFNDKLAAPQVDVVCTLVVSSALCASPLARKARVWPSWVLPVGFAMFGALLFYQTLLHIEREPWAVTAGAVFMLVAWLAPFSPRNGSADDLAAESALEPSDGFHSG